MLARLIILFTLVPLVELVILIRIGQAISLGPTLVLIAVTGIAGAALARHQGFKTLGNIQSDLAEGKMPAGHMVDGLLILIAGSLLITPGVITDAVGFSLLVPFVRTRIRDRLRRYFEGRIDVIHPSGTFVPDPDAFIDVEATDATPPSRERADQNR